MYKPTKDPGQKMMLGPQMIPWPEMAALSVTKDWNELKNLDSGFELYIPYIFLKRNSHDI